MLLTRNTFSLESADSRASWPNINHKSREKTDSKPNPGDSLLPFEIVCLISDSVAQPGIGTVEKGKLHMIDGRTEDVIANEVQELVAKRRLPDLAGYGMRRFVHYFPQKG